MLYGVYSWLLTGLPEFVRFFSEHFDHITFGLAGAVVPVKAAFRGVFGKPPYLNSKLCVEDFLNGVLIAPFFALSLTVFFPELFAKLAEHPLEVSIAGTIAMFVGVEKILSL